MRVIRKNTRNIQRIALFMTLDRRKKFLSRFYLYFQKYEFAGKSVIHSWSSVDRKLLYEVRGSRSILEGESRDVETADEDAQSRSRRNILGSIVGSFEAGHATRNRFLPLSQTPLNFVLDIHNLPQKQRGSNYTSFSRLDL